MYSKEDMMHNPAPHSFDVASLNSRYYFFQRWEVFDGCFTNGPKDVLRACSFLGLPARLDGQRVLDIAPWNGLFSFECARRGAAEVVALGPEDPDSTGFSAIKELTNAQNVRYVRDSLYNIENHNLGEFDMVLFLGVIYHLRHPLLALDTLYDHCKTSLYVDSAIIDHGKHIVRPERFDGLGEWKDVPLVYFSQRDEVRQKADHTNWFKPNLPALCDFIETSGFKVTHTHHTPDWGYVSAQKSQREFKVGFEGYNERIAHMKPRT